MIYLSLRPYNVHNGEDYYILDTGRPVIQIGIRCNSSVSKANRQAERVKK